MILDIFTTGSNLVKLKEGLAYRHDVPDGMPTKQYLEQLVEQYLIHEARTGLVSKARIQLKQNVDNTDLLG